MHQQAKSLKLHKLKGASEFNVRGFICQIIDNDGVTILREWNEPYFDKIAIKDCHYWLTEKYGDQNGQKQ